MKTSELIGPALDWAVAKCEGVSAESWHHYYIGTDPGDYSGDRYSFSTNWSQGGPIIERKSIALRVWAETGWQADKWNFKFINGHQSGPTPLIATMRCYVASKLGDEIDIPKELL
jgi:hypothetical protein